MQRNRSIAVSGLAGVALWCVAGLACAQQAPDAAIEPAVVVAPAFVEPAIVDATVASDSAFGSAVDPGALSDMFDMKTKQAIWRGTASGTVPDSPEDVNAKAQAGVDKMFAAFPPGSAPPAK